MTVEDRGLEVAQLGVDLPHRLFQIFQILEDEAIGTDKLAHLFHFTAMGNELVGGGHVDAVDVGEANFRRRRGEVDLGCPRFTGHLDDLLGGGTTHDGIIHQQHLLALEFGADGVELAAHRLLALGLARHDEGTADVAVLHEALTVRQAQGVGDFQRHVAGSLGDGDDHVHVEIVPLPCDLLAQLATHVEAGGIDGDLVDEGVGTGEVDVFEDAGVHLRVLRTLLGEELALLGDVDGLARGDVTHRLEADGVEGHALGGEHVLHLPLLVDPATQDQRANAVRVTEPDEAVADHQRDHGIGAADLLVHLAHRREDIFRAQRHLVAQVQLVGQHVQQHFGVRGGVDVAAGHLELLLLELLGVGEVAVVGQHHAVGGVHVKRLRLCRTGAACGGITDVSDADIPFQALHVAHFKHILHQTVGLALPEVSTVNGHDPGGILSPVLQHRQGVVEGLIDGGGANYTDNTAHVFATSKSLYLLKKTGRVHHEPEKPLDHRLELRHQPGRHPPVALGEAGEGIHEKQQGADDQHPANGAKTDPEHPVGAGKPGLFHQQAHHVVHHAAEDQGRHEQGGDGQTVANHGIGERGEIDGEIGIEMAGNEKGDEPGDQRHGLLEKASHQADEGGETDDADDGVINPDHRKRCPAKLRRSLTKTIAQCLIKLCYRPEGSYPFPLRRVSRAQNAQRHGMPWRCRLQRALTRCGSGRPCRIAAQPGWRCGHLPAGSSRARPPGYDPPPDRNHSGCE